MRFWMCLAAMAVVFQQPPPVPETWYFDGESVVVAPADDSDAAEFTAQAVPPQTNTLVESSWSPEGVWFAATANEADPDALTREFRPFAANREGRMLESLTPFQTARMAWSPAEDMLLVAGAVSETETDPDTGLEVVDMRVSLIVAAADAAVIEAEFTQIENLVATGQLPLLAWTDDGRYAVATYFDDYSVFPDVPEDQTALVFDIEAGTVTEMTVPRTVRAFSGDGSYAFQDAQGFLIVENITDERRQMFANAPERVDIIQWQGERAVLGYDGLWLLDMTDDPALLQITDDAGRNGLWQTASMQLTLGTDDGFWSPDGATIVFTDTDGLLYALDPETLDVTPVRGGVTGWGWSGPTILTLAEGIPEPGAMGFSEYAFYTYDLESGQPGQEIRATEPVWFSPDGAYAAGVDVNSPFVVNMDTGEVTRLAAHSARPTDVPHDYAGRVEWHPEQPWFLLIENAFVSIGEDAPFTYTIVAADGSTRRELTACTTLACAGWAP